MIRLRTRIHDRFSIEFKIWYEHDAKTDTAGKQKTSFRLENWIFVPASLDINALTYSREQFYSDIKSYYRAITPVYSLKEMASGENNRVFGSPPDTGNSAQKPEAPKPEIEMNPGACSPLDYLSNAVFNVANYPSNSNIIEYEYQIKMFCAIFKSAMREGYNGLKLLKEHVSKNLPETSLREDDAIQLFKEEAYAVLTSYGRLSDYLKGKTEGKLYNFYTFGEEFLINLAELYTYKIYDNISRSPKVITWLQELGKYKRERGYGALKRADDVYNGNLLYRWSVLKKYVESDLFLSVDKRKSGVIKEQVYYSLAAGLSMIFATAIAFTFQQKYGNFTMPLFVALVVSYMLKDRIKELVRSAFSSNRKLKYFDNKTTLSVKETVIGKSREGFDIVPQSKVPLEIIEMRNRSIIVDVENRMNEESVLFYRNLIELDKNKLNSTSEYEIAGINEIILFNLSSFVRKMDNPQSPYYICEENTVSDILVNKIYYLNFIFQFTHNGISSRKRYRVMMNRDGILNLEMLDV